MAAIVSGVRDKLGSERPIQRPGYSLHVIFVVDLSSTMNLFIRRLKQDVYAFILSIASGLANKNANIEGLTARIAFFSGANGSFGVSRILDLQKEPSVFRESLYSLEADPDNYDSGPSQGLVALASAINTVRVDSRAKGIARKRRVICLWTDRAAETNHDDGLLRITLSSTTDAWEDADSSPDRLILFAPSQTPWDAISANWPNTIHITSRAGEGLHEFDLNAIVNTIINSI